MATACELYTSQLSPLYTSVLSTSELYRKSPFLAVGDAGLLASVPIGNLNFSPCSSIFLSKRYFEKRLHGYTGDCLGAVEQLAECICILFYLGLWKYI